MSLNEVPVPERRDPMSEDGSRRDLNWPPAPEPLPASVVDNHTHLQIKDGREGLTLDEQMERAAEVGVDKVVQIGCDLKSAEWTVAEAVAHPSVLGGVSIHPNDAARMEAARGRTALRQAIERIGELAQHPRVRTISETGLDYFRTREPAGHEVQKWAFREHIALAKDLDLTMQIHCRDAHADVLEILLADGAPARTVFHCFAADAEFAKVAVARGWFCSFAGTVTFKKNDELRAAAQVTPVGQLLVETDAPYLTPEPYRGRPNAPYLMPHTVRALAELKSMDVAEFCQRVSTTCEALYGPW